MKIRSLHFITFAVLLAVPVFAYGQGVGAGRAGATGGTYTITGKVTLPDNKPAVGARVDASCDFTSSSASTDNTGVYLITGMPAGNCKVTAKVDGFEPVTENRQITRDTPAGQTIYVPIFLRADPLTSNPLYAVVPKSAFDKYKKAVEKIEKGDLDAALTLLDQATAAHANFAAAWYQRGQIYLRKNDNEKAIEAFVKAIQIKDDYLEAKYGFGLAQFQKKDYAVSEAVFRDVLQKIDMPEAHLNRGISLFYLKKPEAAETELKSAAASKSGDKLALAHLYLGQIYIQRKANADAISELQKYLELVPKAPNADRIKTTIADLKKQG